MSLAIDSSILIELIRGSKTDICARFDAARSGDVRLVLSSLVYHEVAFGALRSARPDRNFGLVEAMADVLDIEPWCREDGLEAARVRAELDGAGTPIGFADALIAGHARRRGHALVTANVRHFALVVDLTLIDWSISSEPLEPSPYLNSLRRAREEN